MMAQPNEKTSVHRSHSSTLFLPLLLTSTALTAWFFFQTLQLLQERAALNRLQEAQAEVYANAQKMRAQLDVLAGGTARLAAQGNPNAGLIVEEFRKRGVTLSPAPAGQ